MMVGGPALYLVGESLVRLRMRSSLSRRRLVAVIALVLLGMLGRQLPALALSAEVAAFLAVLTAWDLGSLSGCARDAANVVQVSASPGAVSEAEALRAVREDGDGTSDFVPRERPRKPIGVLRRDVDVLRGVPDEERRCGGRDERAE